MEILKSFSGFFYHTNTLKVYYRPEMTDKKIFEQIVWELNLPKTKIRKEFRTVKLEDMLKNIQQGIMMTLNADIAVLEDAKQKINSDFLTFCRADDHPASDPDSSVGFTCNIIPSKDNIGISKLNLGIKVVKRLDLEKKFSTVIIDNGHHTWDHVRPYAEWFMNTTLEKIFAYIDDCTALIQELNQIVEYYPQLVVMWNDRQTVMTTYRQIENLGNNYRIDGHHYLEHQIMMTQFVELLEKTRKEMLEKHPTWFSETGELPVCSGRM